MKFFTLARTGSAQDVDARQSRDFRIAVGLMIAAGLALTVAAFGARMG